MAATSIHLKGHPASQRLKPSRQIDQCQSEHEGPLANAVALPRTGRLVCEQVHIRGKIPHDPKSELFPGYPSFDKRHAAETRLLSTLRGPSSVAKLRPAAVVPMILFAPGCLEACSSASRLWTEAELSRGQGPPSTARRS